MLTDAELNQMAADAAEMQRLREKATSGPWLRDLERPRTILCAQLGLVGGVLYNTNGGPDADFIAAARSDKSAEHVDRLVQEVRTLQDTIRRMVPHPTYRRLFNQPELLAEYLNLNGDNPIGIRRTIEACHIHGVPVPEHLKPYESEVK